ncbi:Adenine permease AdeP [Aquicella siphonis]|uniref:Adenine permease AdeP n=1 Tax=Aquicella siphonis TaxID=254247 RepID=A0A5E4PG99_9COXI|nr:NCS2 family permease [Aquicella siphonis]VVC75884.1 Adenine permease AdeP [Aquicella siphonis]
MLSNLFRLGENQTNVKIEVMAGLTTFLTMSYIIFINPAILSETGMDKGAVFVATCLAASLGCFLMGLLANYPIALAPGMALNTYFTYSVVLGSGHSWQIALGAVFLSGLIFLLLSVFPIREYIINSIPKSLKVAIVAGIGLFLGMIGFKSAQIITGSPATLVKLGNLHQPSALLAIFGFFLIIGLEALGVMASILISILSVTFISVALGYNQFQGLISMPPSLAPTLLQLDLGGAFQLGIAAIVFAFLFVDLFDNTGTLIGIAYKAGLMDKQGKLPRIGRVLIADSLAAIFSALLGTSTTTSYLESTVGVKVGGRTGLMSIIVGILFLLALFLSPLARSIPIYATAPALVYVACLMAHAFTDIEWNDPTEYAPAVITAITMPLAFSIADGIAFGFITYTFAKLLSGRIRELNITIILLTAAFLLKYALLQ